MEPLPPSGRRCKSADRGRPRPREGAGSRRRHPSPKPGRYELCTAFLERLKDFRVLDPACGSGNFLYLALGAQGPGARVKSSARSRPAARLPPSAPRPCSASKSIPTPPSWRACRSGSAKSSGCARNGFDASRNPILKPLETIECRDAILNADGTEAEWPEADVVVGNPPFLGGKKLS